MEKSLVIEFVGPPGGGKTTNCKSFCAQLERHAIVAYEFAHVKQHLYKQSVPGKIRIGLKTLKQHGSQVFQFFLFLLTNGIWSADSFFRYVKLCLFNQALQDFIASKPNAIVLLDQWIIQGLWSATIFRARNIEKLPAKLHRFYFPVDYILYFDVDVETAASRVETRQTETSRFDKMPESKRLHMMHKYNEYLLFLYEGAQAKQKWVVSALENPEQNAIDFYSRLKQLKAIN